MPSTGAAVTGCVSGGRVTTGAAVGGTVGAAVAAGFVAVVGFVVVSCGYVVPVSTGLSGSTYVLAPLEPSSL